MDVVSFQSGPWEGECLPADGARLSRLRYAGHDLLTPKPTAFRPPVQDFGEYETRPVYGHDDCFPTVDACELPDRSEVCIRDHGDLCWLRWEVSFQGRHLTCRTRSAVLPAVRFTRMLTFAGDSLTWRFEVLNESLESLPCLHVMHALMPLDKVVSLRLPGFDAAIDETAGRAADFTSAESCAARLLRLPRGRATMLLLRGVKEGRFQIAFGDKLDVVVDWPVELFPTLGIWWNNGGYPDEDGSRRTECALEPIPGRWSSLARSYAERTYLSVGAGKRRTWEITWRATAR